MTGPVVDPILDDYGRPTWPAAAVGLLTPTITVDGHRLARLGPAGTWCVETQAGTWAPIGRARCAHDLAHRLADRVYELESRS